MKTKSFTLPLAALFLAAIACAHAADEKPAPAATPSPEDMAPSQVRITVLMLTMPEEKFLGLLPDLNDKVKIEKVIPDLLDSAKRKEITLEGFPMVVTKSGQRAVMETGREINDDEPPRIPKIYSFPNGGYTPVTPATPTYFETRQVGITLEVEPVIGPDGKLIDLNLAPQHVEGPVYKTVPVPKDKDIAGADGKDVHLQDFFTLKTTTSLALMSGQHVLLGVFKKEKPAGSVEIFILGAEIISAAK
ncbi:MAG TPA: hypothetical protein VG733_00740 [Chthoniobacteraceae bacterium]|nr:hypothetical protein [Chthoniobacteraceae bacterium]